jgi:hypothetical protein
LKKA